jgi:hypothetical protein
MKYPLLISALLTSTALADTWTVDDDGKADFDGYVNVNDLLIIIGYWGNNTPQADLNFDGIVDVTDLLIVVGNWGACE